MEQAIGSVSRLKEKKKLVVVSDSSYSCAKPILDRGTIQCSLMRLAMSVWFLYNTSEADGTTPIFVAN